LLGVTMDSELRYRSHMANAATKGLRAALALKRLNMTSPSMARQLFTSMVAPVVDYAAIVWKHAIVSAPLAALNRVQRTGAQAVTGAFSTVAIAVAEAEAHLDPVEVRQGKKTVKGWINILTLPKSNPLGRVKIRSTQRFNSPLAKLKTTLARTLPTPMEKIRPYSLQPWAPRLVVNDMKDIEAKQSFIDALRGVLVVISSSVGNGKVAASVAIKFAGQTLPGRPPQHSKFATSATVMGSHENQNPYTAELAMIRRELERASGAHNEDIHIITRSLATVQAVLRPGQQSGQSDIVGLYKAARLLQGRGNRVSLFWLPKEVESKQHEAAKSAAKRLTAKEQQETPGPYKAKATATRLAIRNIQKASTIPKGIGAFTTTMDCALPGRHTRKLYDSLNKVEAKILIQLRTGMGRLNTYLHRIGAVESPMCSCGREKESVKHFLFRCRRWTSFRAPLLECTTTRRGDLSFYLGGKSPTNDKSKSWQPQLGAVRATIKYAMSTGNLEATSPL
jgi:hypothetical protein